MMGAMASGTGWKVVKPHIPLIKFRKGGVKLNVGSARTIDQVQGTQGVSAPNVSSRTVSRGITLEDWQLPLKYRRTPLDQEEIDYINRGGPA